jgi:hypothetical protein
MTEVDRYYQILEIAPGATTEDIEQSYQDLSWIWQPDRFVGNPRLQKIAQQKLQDINHAHDHLTTLHSRPRTSTIPSTAYPQAYYPAYLPRYGTSYEPEVCSSPRGQDWQGSFEAVTREYRGSKQSKQREVSTWLD